MFPTICVKIFPRHHQLRLRLRVNGEKLDKTFRLDPVNIYQDQVKFKLSFQTVGNHLNFHLGDGIFSVYPKKICVTKDYNETRAD